MMPTGWPDLDHLVRLTDDVGVLQHATFDIPNRAHGYCTDDVARALIVAVDALRHPPTAELGDRLGGIYLAYLLDAQSDDGRFRNFMGYDRTWQDHVGSEDSFGRALWGLGYAVARAPHASWRELAARLLVRALDHVPNLEYLRARAYAVLGLAYALEAPPPLQAPAIRAALETALGAIRSAFDAVAGPGWTWCEPVMTYDNARIPEALMRGGRAVGDERAVELGSHALGFLAEVTVENGIFVPVGNDGWYPRGGVKATYGQQPLEAAATVAAALLAEDLTGDHRWRWLANTAGNWFFGGNTARATLVSGGGCRDGIDAHGANANMGAESTLAYLLAAVALAERASHELRLARPI